MIDLLTACWFGVIGACVGSFLNVVAYRMPLGMSVIWKPSHCPKCKTEILARDNVPVLGWLWLRGKCRSCGEPISPRYAIVEAVMGLTFFVLCYAEVFSGGANLPTGPLTAGRGALENVIEPNWTLLGVYAFHCLLMCLLMCAVLVDQDEKEIPVLIVLSIFIPIGLGIGSDFLNVAHAGISNNSKTPAINIGITFAVLISIFAIWKQTNTSKLSQTNFGLSLILAIGYLGFGCFSSFMIVVLGVSVFALSFPPLRNLLSKRVWVFGIFLAALLQIVFWKQLHELIAL